MAIDLAAELDESAIRVHVAAADAESAIRAAGEGLVASGAATADYVEAMVEAVRTHGPYIVLAPGIALAHARPSAAVLRSGLSFASLAAPIAFGHAVNDPVRLVIGLAAIDHDSHLGLLAALAGVLSDPAKVDALAAAAEPSAVRSLLAEYSAA